MKKVVFLALIVLIVFVLAGCDSKLQPVPPSATINEEKQISIQMKEIPVQIQEICLQKVETLEDLAGKGFFLPRLKTSKYYIKDNTIRINRLDCWMTVPETSTKTYDVWKFENPKSNVFNEINYIFWQDNESHHVPVKFKSYDSKTECVTFEIIKE